MRILIISKEAWRDEQNGGNVLSNMFQGFDAEFAQIYCTANEPNNRICKRYYQLTDKMMVNSILHRKNAGKKIDYQEYPIQTETRRENYSGVKRFNSDTVRVIREILWKVAKWNDQELIEFAKEFEPDIIFAPCYGNHYMIKLTKMMESVLHIPIISYISDDFYSNRQFKFSPVYWINHFILRAHVREVFSLYTLVYTMTDEQKLQCEKVFHANMKVLRKSGNFDDTRIKEKCNDPIKLVYAGGIYLNRWKTLGVLVDTLKRINSGKVRMTLDIFTNTEIDGNIGKKLNDGRNCRMHSAISMDALKKVYAGSDIALHVEGFDLKNKSMVRLSFSTKIVDCLDSGCAVMAICDSEQAGFCLSKKK